MLILGSCNAHSRPGPGASLGQQRALLKLLTYFCFLAKYWNDFPISGEKLEREEVDILIKECCDPEDDDGFIPYERKCNLTHNLLQPSFISSQETLYISFFIFYYETFFPQFCIYSKNFYIILKFNIFSVLEESVCWASPRAVWRLVTRFPPFLTPSPGQHHAGTRI